MPRLTFEGNFCDIAMCRENTCPYNGMCSQRQTWERLKAYEDAEQDGRLVVLPCKVGDDVWFVRKFGKERCIKRAEVSCINIDCRGKVFVSARRISGGYIGKTVFLTREEAEAALAQEGGKDHA